MNLAICTIQRDRAPWLEEWIKFHHLVGFRKFYVFLHRCTDHSAEVVMRLAQDIDISAFTLSADVFRPQLAAYQHCYSNFGDKHDWMAFIDGDEFLFSPGHTEITSQIEPFEDQPVGALGVYWACFGSSGHQQEPQGLVIDNYRQRAPMDFEANRHFKSIVRGRQGSDFSILQNAHFFQTRHGTFDTAMRPLSHGKVDFEPCHDLLRINHYVTQSRAYFLNFKQNSGAADAGALAVRSEEWWQTHDRNDVRDDSLTHLRGDLVARMQATAPGP